MIEKDDLVEYETASSLLVGLMIRTPFKALHSLAAHYIGWRSWRKYCRYRAHQMRKHTYERFESLRRGEGFMGRAER